jgi:hypothetical protein
VIPRWPEGTAAVLATAEAHAIPVSTAVRTSDTTVHFALGRRRTTLDHLRRDPRAALVVMAAGVAFTLHGNVTELLEEVEGAVALRLDVESVQDHLQPTFVIEAGVVWRWTDEHAATRDAAIRAQLRTR